MKLGEGAVGKIELVSASLGISKVNLQTGILTEIQLCRKGKVGVKDKKVSRFCGGEISKPLAILNGSWPPLALVGERRPLRALPAMQQCHQS